LNINNLISSTIEVTDSFQNSSTLQTQMLLENENIHNTTNFENFTQCIKGNRPRSNSIEQFKRRPITSNSFVTSYNYFDNVLTLPNWILIVEDEMMWAQCVIRLIVIAHSKLWYYTILLIGNASTDRVV